MQKQIIRNVHEPGHINAQKVEKILRQEYYFPSVQKKVLDVISNCVSCILAVKKSGKQEGFLSPIEKVDIPLHTYHIDHLGPMPSTAKNYKYIFAVMDGFTKFVWIFPVKTTTTDEVLKKMGFLEDIFGNPHRIVSDKGTAFTSTAFKEYCDQRQIQNIQITTGIPRGNGQVERMNRIIIEMLTKLSIQNPLKWYQHVSRLQRTINTTVSRATKKNAI